MVSADVFAIIIQFFLKEKKHSFLLWLFELLLSLIL